jgi:hypothetical protein
MRTIKRILCALFGHKYVVHRVFNPGARQVGCTRCNRKWAMHDNTRSFIEWDGELESMYRSFGQCEEVKTACKCLIQTINRGVDDA